MTDKPDTDLSRRRALTRIAALALAAYSVPAVTTLSQARASGNDGGSGGGNSGGSGGGGGSHSSDPSHSTGPSHSSNDDHDGCASDSTDQSCDSTSG